MITFTNHPEENLLGFVMGEKIDETGIQQLLEAMQEKVRQYGKVKLYGEFKGFEGWDSFKSMITTFKLKLEAWKGIEKYALVTDKEWIRNTAKLSDILTPHFEVRVFNTKEEAIEWLRKPTETLLKHGIASLTLSEDYLTGFAVVGKLIPQDYELMNEIFASQLTKYGKLRIYLEVIHFQGISLAALWEDIKTEIKYYKDIEKVVVVAKKGWWEKVTEISDLITPGIDMKFFELEKREVAIEWLK